MNSSRGHSQQRTDSSKRKAPVSVPVAIHLFLTQTAALGLAKSTAKTYANSLRRICSALPGDLAIEDLTSGCLLLAIESLAHTQSAPDLFSPATMNRHRSAMRSFCRWACNSGLIDHDPALVLSFWRASPNPALPMSEAEIGQMLLTIRDSPDTLAHRGLSSVLLLRFLMN